MKCLYDIYLKKKVKIRTLLLGVFCCCCLFIFFITYMKPGIFKKLKCNQEMFLLSSLKESVMISPPFEVEKNTSTQYNYFTDFIFSYLIVVL